MAVREGTRHVRLAIQSWFTLEGLCQVGTSGSRAMERQGLELAVPLHVPSSDVTD